MTEDEGHHPLTAAVGKIVALVVLAVLVAIILAGVAYWIVLIVLEI